MTACGRSPAVGLHIQGTGKDAQERFGMAGQAGNRAMNNHRKHNLVLRIGIVGCGAIGTQLAKAVAGKKLSGLRLAGVHDIDPLRARRLAKGLRPAPAVLDLPALAKASDLLVEAAGMAAVPAVARAALADRKHLLVMSVGALLQEPWLERFRRVGGRLYYPSGAIAGLDGLRAAAAGGLRRVTLTTRKPPQSLAGAPYFSVRGKDPAAITSATTIFRGTAREAVRLFPANINVSAAVSLAGLGPEKTRVCIIADPAVKRNIHTLTAEGVFGKLCATVENRPSADNPKTSCLAIFSALALLRSIQADLSPGRYYKGHPCILRPL